MNKTILLFLLILTTISCKNQKNNINVNINDVKNGTKVWLKMQVNNSEIVVIDSTTVENGKFGFYKKIEKPIIYGIFIDNLQKGIYPLIDKDNILNIEAYKDSLIKSKITGSKLHDDLTNLRDFRAKNNKQIGKLRRSLKLLDKKDTAAFSNLRFKIYSLSNDIFVKDWNYANENPNSVVSVMALSKMNLNPYSKDSIKKAFDKLSEDVKNSNYAKPLKMRLEYFDKVPSKPNNKESN